MVATSFFVSTALQISLANMFRATLCILFRPHTHPVIEHQRHRALLSNHPGWRPAHILQQWYRHIRPTLMAILQILETSSEQQD
jgi:hypothetical protein